MTRTLAIMLALIIAALGWQSWRLNNARHTIDTQETALETKARELAKKNSQLISLSILTETNSREQTRLYAAAENTTALLRHRQHRIEEFKRENEDLRRWADTPLPVDIIRLRARPALAGGAAYREWLGKATVDAIQLRFTGSIQRDDTGEVQAVELVVRGRHKELDSGEWKTGESSTTKVTSTNSYAKLTINGEVLYEVDLVNMIEIVDGVDLMEAHRNALGL